MKVVRAESAGTCYGVQRALDLAYAAVESHDALTSLGPLIHNPRVVSDLQAHGMRVAESVDEVGNGAVLIRSHGVTPQVHRELTERCTEVIDATCPHVLRAQKTAARLASQGRFVIIVGERDHPEVQGLCAWCTDAGGQCLVVAGAHELPANIESPVGLIAQTTLPGHLFAEVADELEARGLDIEAVCTVCDATSSRQHAARELARRVDCMVVVGGRNSSNTRRLYDVCAEIAPRALLVESVEDLEKSQFIGVNTVGVTAGASTPEDQIAAIEDCLRCW